MNVQLEQKPNCQVNLHFEIPSEEVASQRKEVTKEFLRYTRIPGFRPGKAPAHVVETRFASEIAKELEKRVVSDSIKKAINEHKLRVLQVQEVNHVNFGEDKSMSFTASVITSPEFELPDYKNLEVELPDAKVSDEDVERMIENLREQQADFPDVEGRGLDWGDFVVIDYAATVEGKPAEEKYPALPRPLRGGRNFWVRMDEKTFLPGFCDQLLGAKPEESRTFEIEVPSDHPVEELRGAKLHYDVRAVAVKTRALPELTDEFAQRTHIADTMEALREEVRKGITANAEREYEMRKRDGAVRQLLSKVECELPTQMLRAEIDSVLRDIVSENQSRGIGEDEIRAHEQELIGAAQLSARERLRSTFLLLRIAEQENLKVTEQDLVERVQDMSARYNVTFDKMVKDLRKREALPMLQEQILCRKALDLIASNVTVRPKLEAPATA